jgi:hypothetical protein
MIQIAKIQTSILRILLNMARIVYILFKLQAYRFSMLCSIFRSIFYAFILYLSKP